MLQRLVVHGTLFLTTRDICAGYLAYGPITMTATRGSTDTTFQLPGGGNGGFVYPVGDRVVYEGVRSQPRTYDSELFVSDGTRAGSHLLKNIWPGGGPSHSSYPSDFKRYGTYVTFTADDGHGRALWRTDGTPAGTYKVSG
jgi:ELWxxDGT repeat protein